MKYIIGGLLFLSISVGLVWAYANNEPTENAGVLAQDTSELSIPQKIKDIALPSGYQRVQLIPGSFGNYLQNLPLKTSPIVYLYNGVKKHNQSAQFAVIDADVGKKNLQQCADAVMRLRAEYLYKHQKFPDIKFHFTSGDLATYTHWRNGYRARVRGNKVSWVKSGSYDDSYKTFRKYLETVFMYAGSYSLAKELKKVKNIQNIQVGDVFIQGGFPGHAVLVVDVARHSRTGELLFMLAQSYMPAQDIHILKNPNNRKLNPWYSIAQVQSELETPEWTFKKNNLKRF